MNPARVYIHDGGSGARIGQIVTASEIDRGFMLTELDVASFGLSPDDALAGELNPSRGRIIVIDSDDYPESWVGRVRRVSQRPVLETITVQCESYRSIFSHRTLSGAAFFAGSPARVFAAILDQVNAQNPTGIVAGSLGGGGEAADYDLPYATAMDALDQVAESGGLEWWISTDAQPDGLNLALNLAEARGSNRYGDIALVSPQNVEVTEWAMEADGIEFSRTAVGGTTDTVDPIFDAPAVRAEFSEAAILSKHGTLLVSGLDNDSPLVRNESVALVEMLKDKGLLLAAAERQLGVPREPFLRVSITVHEFLPVCVGDLVYARLTDVFLTPLWESPVRVLAVQPDEQEGILDMVVEVRRFATTEQAVT